VNKALWLLLGFQFRGWLRSLLRGLRSFRRAFLGLVGLSVLLVMMLVPLFVRGRSTIDPEQLRAYGPTMMLASCLLNVLISTGERAIYFPPAEVNFLFSAPLGRREILLYKILFVLLIALPTSVVMAVLLNTYAASPVAAYVSIVLALMFLQLFSMAVSLVAMTIGTSLYSRARVLIACVLALLVVAALILGKGEGVNLTDLRTALVENPVWQVVTWPLRSFFDAFLARNWSELAPAALIALVVDLAMVCIVLLLDLHYLETATFASERIYARLQELRRGGMLSASRYSGKTRLSLPALPWWGGIGPILWRQLLAAQRGLLKLVLVFGILGLVMVMPMLDRLRAAGENDLPVLQVPVMLISLTLFLTTLVPFDFRGDIDRIAVLKTLPVPAWQLTVGQLLTPVLLISAMHWLILACTVPFVRDRSLLGLVAVYVVPLNFFLFALENLLFLLYPTRVAANTPADFQGTGRNVLFVFAKGICLGLVLLVASVPGVLVWATTQNRVAAFAAGVPVVVLCGALLVPLVVFAFRAFDVSRDTPA
jgi:ABC-type transport system involved in multi-copper enzyme maturation permease subunit